MPIKPASKVKKIQLFNFKATTSIDQMVLHVRDGYLLGTGLFVDDKDILLVSGTNKDDMTLSMKAYEVTLAKQNYAEGKEIDAENLYITLPGGESYPALSILYNHLIEMLDLLINIPSSTYKSCVTADKLNIQDLHKQYDIKSIHSFVNCRNVKNITNQTFLTVNLGTILLVRLADCKEMWVVHNICESRKEIQIKKLNCIDDLETCLKLLGSKVSAADRFLRFNH